MFTQNRANNFSGEGQFIFSDDSIDIHPLKYNIIEYTTPNSNLNAVELRRGSTVGAIPSDTVEQEQSTVLRFIVDEDLEVLFTLQEIQNNSAGKGQSKDIFNVHIKNNYNKAIAIGSFSGVFIGNISPLRYSTIENETTVYLDVTLNFLYYTIEKTK